MEWVSGVRSLHKVLKTNESFPFNNVIFSIWIEKDSFYISEKRNILGDKCWKMRRCDIGFYNLWDSSNCWYFRFQRNLQNNEEKIFEVKMLNKKTIVGAQMWHWLLWVDEIALILEEDRSFRFRYYLQKKEEKIFEEKVLKEKSWWCGSPDVKYEFKVNVIALILEKDWNFRFQYYFQQKKRKYLRWKSW